MAPPQLHHHQLHFILVPFMAQGHMIPMIDMAKLFAQRGVMVTIVSTQQNFLRYQSVIDRAIQSGLPIRLLKLKFPSKEAGLPEGCENMDTLPSADLMLNFFAATNMLQHPLEKSLEELQPPKPSCIISDWLLTWTSETANKLQIPRIMFHGTSAFSHLCFHSLIQSKIHERVSSDSEPFVMPDFPDRIELTKNKLPDFFQKPSPEVKLIMERIRETEETAYGVVINSFYELEPRYVDQYKKASNTKTWCIGPVSLCNKEELDLVDRGKKAAIDKNQCLRWLDSKEPKSVIYVCLGSLARLLLPQLIEIGLALEASNHPFIWVIGGGDGNKELENWMSEEKFEGRIGNGGLVIRGWAPQVMILSHPATGGFITHCGWNSTLEGVSAGVGMITWPFFADQFLNEKLIVEVLKVGFRAGADEFIKWRQEELGTMVVKKEEIEKAVRILMGKSEEGEELRRRAEEFGKMARKAMEEGGSSHLNLTLFIQDIMNQVA